MPSLEKYFPKEPQKIIKKHTDVHKALMELIVTNLTINTAVIIAFQYYIPHLQYFILIPLSIIFVVLCNIIREYRFHKNYYYYHVAQAYFKCSSNMNGIQQINYIKKGLICYDKFLRKNISLRISNIDELLKRIILKIEDKNSLKILNEVDWKNYFSLSNKLKSFYDIPNDVLNLISLKNRIWNKELLEFLGFIIPIMVAIPSLIDLGNYFFSFLNSIL